MDESQWSCGILTDWNQPSSLWRTAIETRRCSWQIFQANWILSSTYCGNIQDVIHSHSPRSAGKVHFVDNRPEATHVQRLCCYNIWRYLAIGRSRKESCWGEKGEGRSPKSQRGNVGSGVMVIYFLLFFSFSFLFFSFLFIREWWWVLSYVVICKLLEIGLHKISTTFSLTPWRI